MSKPTKNPETIDPTALLSSNGRYVLEVLSDTGNPLAGVA